MRDNLKDFVDANRDAFDHRAPSEDLWNKIKPQVVPQIQEKKIKPFWRWMSVAAVTLLLGAAAFMIFDQHEEGDRTSKLAVSSSVTNEKSEQKQITPTEDHLAKDQRNQVDAVAQTTIATPDKVESPTLRKSTILVAEAPVGQEEKIDYVQMLRDSTSASTRLGAVLALKDQGNLNQGDVSALEQTAIADQNSNVRMAAIETILDGMTPVERQQKVQDFFVQQNDPTLQMELMQLMAQQEEPVIKETTKEKLNEIVEDPLTLRFVKEQAYAVLMNQ